MTQPSKVIIIYLGPLHLEETKNHFSSNDDMMNSTTTEQWISYAQPALFFLCVGG